MEEDTTLYLQLHKLSAINSEEALDLILSTLWKTRRTGLSPSDKSNFQSLLNIFSPSDLDPLLACLRSLIRKCVHHNFTGDDLLKLLPPDLPLDLQSILVLLYQKYQNQWKEDISREQQSLPRTNVSYQVKTSLPPSFASFPSAELSAPLWPRQDDPISHFNQNDFGTSTIISGTNGLSMAHMSLQREPGVPENLGILPRLKSMTWTMENCSSSPANRVALISLKLHDYTKSPLGETEVKFQLTRDTLEAMLRSMTYISEQLASSVSCSPGPAQKKQRQ